MRFKCFLRLIFFFTILMSLCGCSSKKNLKVKEDNSMKLCSNDRHLQFKDIILFEAKEDYALSKAHIDICNKIADFYKLTVKKEKMPFIGYYDDSQIKIPTAFVYEGTARGKVPEYNLRKNYGMKEGGYLLIGKNYAQSVTKKVRDRYKTDFSFYFVIAHEFAHVLQYQIGNDFLVAIGKLPYTDENHIPKSEMSKLIDYKHSIFTNGYDNLNEKAKELNADYMAGFYFARRFTFPLIFSMIKEKDETKKDRFEERVTFINTEIRNFIKGLTSKSSINTHGTYEERVNAFLNGSKHFIDSALKKNKLPTDPIPRLLSDLYRRIEMENKSGN